MAKCIYCSEPAGSGEHWLPATFGAIKGLEKLRERLCDPCNNALGALDQEVATTGPTGMAKSFLEIRGRHKEPSKNPYLYRVMGKESATTMMMPCPYGPYQIFGETYKTDTGEIRVLPLRQLVFKTSDGTMVPIPFPPAYDAGRLKALMKERGVEDAALEAIYLGTNESLEDSDHMRRVLTDAIGMFSGVVAYGGIGESGGRKDIALTFGISQEYMRGIAKIAFHYYLAMSVEHTGAEEIFQPVRQYVRHGEGSHEQFIRLTSEQFIPPLMEGKSPSLFSHYFHCQQRDGHLVVTVQMFAGPEHVPPPSRVLLAVTNEHVTSRLHLVGYYGEKRDGYDGAIGDVTSILA